MSLITINADMAAVAAQLKRIADKMEEIWPTTQLVEPEMLKESDIVHVGVDPADGEDIQLWHAYAPRQYPNTYDK